MVFAPWFQTHVQQPIITSFGDNATLTFLFGDAAFGIEDLGKLGPKEFLQFDDRKRRGLRS